MIESTMNSKSKKYYYSLDVLRVVCFICLIFCSYGFPISILNIVGPFLNVFTCVLFTIYGYLTIHDNADYKSKIVKCGKAFLMAAFIYLVLLEGVSLLGGGVHITSLFTIPNILNLLVLNYWAPSFGATIWMIQSTLYALIVCLLLDKIKILKKGKLIICVLLFVFAILVGEGAALINFSVLGYNYISGNFLTRALPYMLLGSILADQKEYYSSYTNVCLFIGGIVLCVVEIYGLAYIGKLIYYNHLIGFIPMAIAIVEWALKHRRFGSEEFFGTACKHVYKAMYYTFNPIGEFLLLACMIMASSQEEYSQYTLYIGIIVVCITLMIGYGYAYLKENKNNKERS